MIIYDIDNDLVIDAKVAIGSITYSEAISKLVPLISKTEFQRKLQDKKFYEKLERDIEKGCIMPPITIAFVDKTLKTSSDKQEIANYFENNFEKSFVLDGIQRLNTLSRLEKSEILDFNKKLYLNVIFSDSVDKLLYRMITLNNGQKPMTPRHQVEVMMANVYDFKKLGIEVQTEKQRAEKTKLNSFNQSDLIQAYLAYMANSPMVDNKKIIQDKMDELIVNKIVSSEPLDNDNSFEEVLTAIAKFQNSTISLKWLKQANNLVGFSVGMKNSSKIILGESVDNFESSIKVFEEAFTDFNPSKIKLGKLRRELSCNYFQNYDKLRKLDSLELLEYFSDLTND
ncbi:conserved hypothetical protein [Tenacibaculum maritimum]|uniref:hypothetical protein n=1 Tax=Tenacibaculum maritimum TaxID=107401 RepID=UPI0012E6B523|nr:hypothetical protein [Tenacibaculum maritimum]CAA0143798.1 conserved hypothetical protein [Tenacibaculum maritimum]CAA0144422.1 conserved hypothetical protein [Tenacibaculum maritimum]CAA0205303.1 conserved hypothetical protein [Tenacibaculum maritimum]